MYSTTSGHQFGVGEVAFCYRALRGDAGQTERDCRTVTLLRKEAD